MKVLSAPSPSPAPPKVPPGDFLAGNRLFIARGRGALGRALNPSCEEGSDDVSETVSLEVGGATVERSLGGYLVKKRKE